MRAFADTSFFYALAVEGAPRHQEAVESYKAFEGEFWLSSHVLAETMSLLTNRRGKPGALSMGRQILAARQTRVIHADDDVAQAWDLFAAHPDWDFDLVDALSFALMRREGIDTAFAPDRHFAQMGFAVLPA